jgi:hypothetical protein
MRHLILSLGVAWALSGAALAAEHHSAPATQGAHALDVSPHPGIPAHPAWVNDTLWTIAILFIAAAIVGGIIRANMPEEIPVSHAHDEPPGSSGHHGPSGTVDPHHPGHGGAPHGHH